MSNFIPKKLKGMMLMLMAFISSFAYAQGPITICDGTDENKNIPFWFYYLDDASAKSQVIYPASELTEFVGKQITGLKFYHKGFSTAWSGNMAVSLAEVDYSTISETAFISANFTEVFNGAVSGDETMNTLEFTFTTPFVYTGQNLVIEIKNTAKGSTYFNHSFYGKNQSSNNAVYGYGSSSRTAQAFLPKVTVSYCETSEYAATVSAETLNFSTLFTGETATKNITISNNGTADLTAAISGIEAPYSVAETSIAIPSLSSVTVPITFAPTEDGSYNQSMTIDLGEAGSFNVTLTGASMTAPTGYQQSFEVGNKSLPEGWSGWSVKTTYNSDSQEYEYESAGASLDYFVGTTIDGTKAVAIKDNSNPAREYPSQYSIYMISPVVEGNILITARGTNSSNYITPELHIYKTIKNQNGTYTIGDEIDITWTSELTNAQWSNGIFVLSEKTPVAVFMNYSAVSMFAADSAEGVTGDGGNEGSGDNDETFDPITICDGTDENSHIPFYFYYNDDATTKSQVIYPASELTEFVGKQITGLKFYNAGYPSAWSSTMAVSLAEVDYSTLMEGNASYIDAEFKEVFRGDMSGDDSMNTLEFTFDTPFVYTGQNLVIEIKNTVKGSGYPSVYFYGKELLGDINATSGWSGSFKDNYGFLPKVTISYGEMKEYAASVSVESIDYATIFSGETVVKDITISNNGSSDLTATISGISAPYSVAESTISIPTLSSATVPVTFAPTTDGTYNQTMTINLGDAGSFNVALSGASMTAPTGYQQSFDVTDKTLPDGWTGWVIKSTYDYDEWDYVFESAESSLDYFVGTEVGGVKAVSILDNANPYRQSPSQYDIYMVSPEISGNVMITARGTNTGDYITPKAKIFKVTCAEDGSYTIGDEIEVSWTTPLSNAEWSKGIFVLSENTQIAVHMHSAAVSTFAADKLKVAEIGDEFTANGLTYIVKSATEAGVTGASNDVIDCSIPATINYCGSQFSVVSIEEDAFYWSNVQSATLPNTITSIGYGAFRSSSLQSINIPASVKTIGEYAFYKTNISSIVIPEGITSIGTSTFSQCENLATVTLPSTLQKIGQAAFYKSAITAIEIPANCTNLGMYVFENCSKLTSASLPTGLTEIPLGLFHGCSSLSSITIPESVVTINEYAFESTALSAIHFPQNVSNLKANAFNNTPITTITVDNLNTTYTVIDGALYTTDKRFIYLYPRITETKSYDIIDGCAAVMGGAFYGCDIKTVTFPEGLIGIDAFGFCLSDLESVELPNTLSELWEQAFAGTKLTKVTLPEGITRLYEAVFADCANLTKVTLPATLTDIGNRAFFRCKALTTINCLGATPAEFDAWETATDPFYEVDCTKVTLNVPEAAVADYQASEWADFFTLINGVDFAGIEGIIADDVEISIENGVISINAENADVVISGVNGVVVRNEKNISGKFSAELPAGVYIITIRTAEGAVTKKVVL